MTTSAVSRRSLLLTVTLLPFGGLVADLEMLRAFEGAARSGQSESPAHVGCLVRFLSLAYALVFPFPSHMDLFHVIIECASTNTQFFINASSCKGAAGIQCFLVPFFPSTEVLLT